MRGTVEAWGRVSQSVITKLLPVEHMVHYTHSVFSECVVESQSQGGWGRWHMPARQIFFIACRGAWSAPRFAAMRRWRTITSK